DQAIVAARNFEADALPIENLRLRKRGLHFAGLPRELWQNTLTRICSAIRLPLRGRHRKKSLAVIEASVVWISRICMSAANEPPVLTSTITSAPAISLIRT